MVKIRFYEYIHIKLCYQSKEEKTMVNKRFWLGMLVIVLVFGMTVVGCEPEHGDVTVTFNANGGQFLDGTTVKSITVPYDSSFSSARTKVPAPTQAGKTFKEWSRVPNPDPNTVYASPDNLNDDLTVYAMWQ
jgi:hypothetical protein